MADTELNMSLCLSLLGIEQESSGSFCVPCPICSVEQGNRKKLLNINVEKNVFRCPRCDAAGGPLHLYGLFKYGYSKEYIQSNRDVSKKLFKEVMGYGKSGLQGHVYTPPVIQKIDVPPTSLEERNNTYTALLRKLKLSDAHYNNLIGRGLREQDIIENGYVSAPKIGFTKIPSELRKEACDLLGVPGFYKKGEVWSLYKTKPGFFIPARDIGFNGNKGMIQGLQIRFDTVSADETRYKWLSTKDMESGSGAETYVHFVGHPEQTCLLTEGPLKADIIHRFIGAPVIAVPGVSSIKNLRPMLDMLWKLGVRRIKTAFDMDYKSNINVQEAYINLILCLNEYGFIVERLTWDENYKGLDDYLKAVYLEKGGKLGLTK